MLLLWVEVTAAGKARVKRLRDIAADIAKRSSEASDARRLKGCIEQRQTIGKKSYGVNYYDRGACPAGVRKEIQYIINSSARSNKN